MALADTLCELEQRLEKSSNEVRETQQKHIKDGTLPTKEQEERLDFLRGKDDKDGGEIMRLRQQINSARRVLATHKIGDDPQSGKDPEERRLSDPLAHEDPNNTRNGAHHYSMFKACVELWSGRGLSGLEKEVSDQMNERSGMPPNCSGFKMPHYDKSLRFADVDKIKKVAELRAAGRAPQIGSRGPAFTDLSKRSAFDMSFSQIDSERRVLNTTAAAGAIPTILDKDWIELLRNQMMVMAAGAREILDLKGKFAIPRQNAAATSYWVAESGSPTGSNQTLDQVLFTPHTIGAFTDISRRFFELTILDSGEAFAKEDLTAILGRGVDLAAFNGTGGGSQPLGIAQNPAITSARTVSLGTNGGVPTWQTLVEMFTIVARGNAASLGEFVYMGNADVEGTLATTAKIGSTFPVFLLDDNGMIYRRRALFTQQVPSNITKGSGSSLSMLLGGIWNQLILAYWSGVDILVDPYTGSSSGTIRIVALQDMDVQVRHNEAFSMIADMITNQSQ